MADNVPITAGVGTDIATDDIGGKHHQRVKVVWGTDGTANDADTATGKPLPVQLRGSDGTDVSNGLPVTGTFFQATQPVSGTFFQATQPVSGTVTTTPPSNASTNVAQLAGTTTDTNSGVKSAGTLRVVLATDQPALTNKLLVTPDSVALPANQSVNVSQINAVTPLMGNGGTGTGSQRVTIASDNTAFSVNAAQSGTWTVQPGNTANTTAWKVDASSVAVPVTDNSGSLTVDAPVGTPVFVRLSDGSTAIATLPVSLASVPSHAVTNAGTFAVQANTEGSKATYRAEGSMAVTGAAIVAVLQGSGTKTIRVTHITVSGVLSTADRGAVEIVRTTGDVTAPTGTVTVTIAKMDTNNATATGVVKSYTSATGGAGSQGIDLARFMWGSATVAPTLFDRSYGGDNGQSFVLRGTSEYCQIFANAAAGTYTGASLSFMIEWTEE